MRNPHTKTIILILGTLLIGCASTGCRPVVRALAKAATKNSSKVDEAVTAGIKTNDEAYELPGKTMINRSSQQVVREALRTDRNEQRQSPTLHANQPPMPAIDIEQSYAPTGAFDAMADFRR